MKGYFKLRWTCVLFLCFSSQIALSATQDENSILNRKHWRTHTTGRYGYHSSRPKNIGGACYKSVFFGDSLCVGFNSKNIFFPLRSFCEDIAIHFSSRSGDLPVQYSNYAVNGTQSGAILNSMKANLPAIRDAHLIGWDAGGNDFLFEAFKFSNPLFRHHYCQLCSLDNELGSFTAQGPDPRCGQKVGTLQTFKSNLRQMLSVLKDNARKDAVVEMMGLYYGHFDWDGNTDLNCIDPASGTYYTNLREALLPVVLKGIHIMMDEVYQLRLQGDQRFGAFDTFARFNSKKPELWEKLKYSPGDNLTEYAVDKILAHESELLDPFKQTYSSSPGHLPFEHLIQNIFGWVDVHPTQSGHDLIEELSQPSLEEIPLPRTSVINSKRECS
jgi:lysophospholipase L1-like esterase